MPDQLTQLPPPPTLPPSNPPSAARPPTLPLHMAPPVPRVAFGVLAEQKTKEKQNKLPRNKTEQNQQTNKQKKPFQDRSGSSFVVVCQTFFFVPCCDCLRLENGTLRYIHSQCFFVPC